MRFQIINDKGMLVMSTDHTICIPPKEHLVSMARAGYKFKIDGKIVSKKKFEELLTKQ